MSQKLHYSITATAREGEPSRVKTSDGRLALEISTPQELGGAGGAGTNPEELLAAGYAGCLLQAVRFEKLRRGLAMDGAEVTCIADLAGDSSGFALNISLDVTMPSLPSEQAEELLAAALATWPYADGRDPHPPAVRLVARNDGPQADADNSSTRRGYGGSLGRVE